MPPGHADTLQQWHAWQGRAQHCAMLQTGLPQHNVALTADQEQALALHKGSSPGTATKHPAKLAHQAFRQGWALEGVSQQTCQQLHSLSQAHLISQDSTPEVLAPGAGSWTLTCEDSIPAVVIDCVRLPVWGVQCALLPQSRQLRCCVSTFLAASTAHYLSKIGGLQN